MMAIAGASWRVAACWPFVSPAGDRRARPYGRSELSVPAGLREPRHWPVRGLARRLQRRAAPVRHRPRNHGGEPRREDRRSQGLLPLARHHLGRARASARITFTSHGLFDERGGFALLSFDLGGLDRVPDRLTFDYSVLFDEEPRHRGFLLVEHNWATGILRERGPDLAGVQSRRPPQGIRRSRPAAVCAAFWPSCASAPITSGWASTT